MRRIYSCVTDPSPDALRLTLTHELRAMGASLEAISRAAGVSVSSMDRFVARKWTPLPDWVVRVRKATIEEMRSRARDYLATWDPLDYGLYREQREAEAQAKRDEAERQLAAARCQ